MLLFNYPGRFQMRHLVRPLLLLAVIVAGAGFALGFVSGCSSSTPTAAPAPQSVAPAPAPAVAAPVEVSPITRDPRTGGLVVRDVPVPGGVNIDARKVGMDPGSGAFIGSIAVRSNDSKKPLKCPDQAKDHCFENADGSIIVHLAKSEAH